MGRPVLNSNPELLIPGNHGSRFILRSRALKRGWEPTGSSNGWKGRHHLPKQRKRSREWIVVSWSDDNLASTIMN